MDNHDGAAPRDWGAIRAEWEAGASVADLARRHCVSEQLIRRVKKREGWARTAPADQPQAATPSPRSNLVVLEGRRSKKSPETETETAPAAAGDVSDEDLIAAMRRVALRGLRELEKAPKLDPEAMSFVMNAAAKTVDKGRDVAGKRRGEASNGEDDTPVRQVTIVRKVVPVEAKSA